MALESEDAQGQSSRHEMPAQLLAVGFEISAASHALSTIATPSIHDAVDFLLLATDHPSLAQPTLQPSSTTVSAKKTSRSDHLCDEIELAEQEFFGQGTLELLRKQIVAERPCDSSSSLHASAFPLDHAIGEAKIGEQCSEQATYSGEPRPEAVSHECMADWELQAQQALIKYFGYVDLKPFQHEALEAWASNRDCFVLAATGSGKSLCFQLPALITGKTVVVISPLISLMHDQCVRLAKHGVSACFLGSGQPDKRIESKAMAGAYSIIYVCPETLTRLIPPLQALARGRGITLFAVDEAHCISKWGHAFRPDYRRLSVIREMFIMDNNKRSTRAIPIMALTATATEHVRGDIIKSLGIDKSGPKMIITSLFRPNLKFSVHHSKTTQYSSYAADFKELIDLYTSFTGDLSAGRDFEQKFCNTNVLECFLSPTLEGGAKSQMSKCELADHDSDTSSQMSLQSDISNTEETEVEGEEDEEDMERRPVDFDASCAEFLGQGPYVEAEAKYTCMDSGCEHLASGPTIIYMPTRKETERLASFLSSYGVKASPYHAKLPKGHLKQVHQQFLSGIVQVVVSTIAFGMGIDKADVRNVIHYGWPQSLEAYYQEAGRAGRDGLLSNCKLYCDMTVLPSLLPSHRDAAQAKAALGMLSDCFRYGLATSKCRVHMLLQHFGENFEDLQCKMCDVCVHGPPPMENLTKEAISLLEQLNRGNTWIKSDILFGKNKRKRDCGDFDEILSTRSVLVALGQQMPLRGRLWWRGFVRVLLDRGYIEETEEVGGLPRSRKLVVPTVRYPRITSHGLLFIEKHLSHSIPHEGGDPLKGSFEIPPLLIHPEGDMTQAKSEHDTDEGKNRQSWRRGWAIPEIRQRRIKRFRDSKYRKIGKKRFSKGRK